MQHDANMKARLIGFTMLVIFIALLVTDVVAAVTYIVGAVMVVWLAVTAQEDMNE